MTRQKALAWYGVMGAVLIVVFGVARGVSGLLTASLAWSLCIVSFVRPPARLRVAALSFGSRIFRERHVWIGTMPLRLFVVLGGATVLYKLWGERLGIGFWVGVTVFYLTALALTAAVAVGTLKKSTRTG